MLKKKIFILALCIALCCCILPAQRHFQTAKSNDFAEISIKPERIITQSAVDSMKTAYGYTTTKSRFSRTQILQTLKQYGDFDKLLDRANSFTIPGLENTFVGIDCNSMVPQGICVTDKYFFTTAYDSDSVCSSVIYAISNNAEHALRCVIVLPMKIHAGGITCDGENVWICGDDEITDNSRFGVVYSVSVRMINDLADSAEAFTLLDENMLTKYKISNSASFCTYYKDRLWVGTFANASESESTYGCIMSYNTAFVDCSNGEKSLKFESFVLLPNRSQGVCFFEKNNETYMLLSRSFARNRQMSGSFISEIRLYKPTFHSKTSAKMTKKGNAVSVFATPPMIEEVCFDVANEKLYAIFESGASKYSINGKTQLQKCRYIFDKIAAIDINRLIG